MNGLKVYIKKLILNFPNSSYIKTNSDNFAMISVDNNEVLTNLSYKLKS